MIENKDKQEMIVKRGNIVLCDLGSAKGSEQFGIRPCVVVQNESGNLFSSTVIVVPVTSKMDRVKLPTHVKISEGYGLEKNSIALCEQLRTVSKTRIGEVCGNVSMEDMKRITSALIVSLEIFKRGEQEAKEQAIRVRTRGKSILELIGIVGIDNLKEYICKYKRDLRQLNAVCSKYRLPIEKLYIEKEELIKIRKLC